MDTEIFRIVYCSHNALDPARQEGSLDQILATSRRNNERVGVTGALLYNDGVFVQTLEGSFEAVQTVFERIQNDDRHEDVVILQAEIVPAPLFADWAMAFAEPENRVAAEILLSRAMADPDDSSSNEILDLLDRLVHQDEVLSSSTA